MVEQKGFTAWFTGLPCCGKTTIAKKVAKILKEKGYKVEHLDGDIVRQNLTSDIPLKNKVTWVNIK